MGIVFIQGKNGSLTIVKGILFVIWVYLNSCNNENAPDCFQDAGEITRTEIDLADFSRITVFEKISLIIKQGETQKVEIETGEYLFKDIVAEVKDDRLIVRNGNGCNFFREYGLTKVYITSPNIKEIRSSTGQPIISDGPLGYTSLFLFSESFTDPEAETTDGEFDLELETGSVSVVVNGIAYFKLKGNTDNLNINIAAGDSRIDAESLLANSVSLNHRGTNDIQINPQQSLTGVIRGTGDVISYNQPPIVEIEELYTGKLVFKD
ncbi:head GIN domain-containing protein [Maribacter sp.]|uniref:head GIN domain-containing protein n=1 Tax=Maribacter sp. TaxID=1897614 RepID=UPI003C7609FF